MSRYSREGTCGGCGAAFRYFLIDSRTDGTGYAYCDACGTTLLLSGASRAGPVDGAAETRLAACSCGGAFRAGASPRCPACRAPITAEDARAFLEANAPRKRKGWTWQGSWQGPYCIVIENRLTSDDWPG